MASFILEDPYRQMNNKTRSEPCISPSLDGESIIFISDQEELGFN